MAASSSSGSVRSASAAACTSRSRSRARSNDTNPVTAKIRRVFEPMEPSDSSVIVPICPSESTWVPPQNSSDVDPACTTRTDDPYLSPKKAMAPMFSASSRDVSVVSTPVPVSTAAFARANTSSSSSLVGAA